MEESSMKEQFGEATERRSALEQDYATVKIELEKTKAEYNVEKENLERKLKRVSAFWFIKITFYIDRCCRRRMDERIVHGRRGNE